MTAGFSSTLLAAVIAQVLANDNYIQLRGAGASFPSTVYAQWIPFYKAARHSINLNMQYDAVGSGSGKKRIKKLTGPPVEYAGSDSVLKESDYKNYPDLQMFPTMAGAVVIGYNVPGVGRLTLSRETLVDIYNGTIIWWNDTRIVEDNAHVPLPEERIRVVARADKSGTTEAFTTALSSFSATWNATMGSFSEGVSSHNTPVKWQPDVIWYYGQTNRGMSGLLLSIMYTLGYLSATDAAELYIPTARIQNQDGNAVEANTSTVQAAMDEFAGLFTPRMTLSLANAPGKLSYPIAAYTYLIIYKTTMRDCQSASALYRYIEWFLTEPQAHKACISLSMVPLSTAVTQRIFTQVLANMDCQGKPVKDLVDAQKYEEEIARQTWRTPVFITVPMIVFLFIVMITYIVYQQIRVNKAIFKQEYLISANAIKMYRKQKEMSKSLASIVVSGPSVASDRTSLTSCKSGMKDKGSKRFGKWKDETIYLQPTSIILDVKLLRRDSKRLLLWMRDQVNHVNVVRFFGITELDDRVYFLASFCHKGTLQDVIYNERFNLDNNFKFSMVTDIATGMNYLHNLNIVHGYLSTGVCLIDARWNVKVADWQLVSLSTAQRISRLNGPIEELMGEKTEIYEDENVLANHLFWTAPELISDRHQLPVKASDVYSYSMVLTEVFTRHHPYDEHLLLKEAKDIINDIVDADIRPKLDGDFPRFLISLLMQLWQPSPLARPPFTKVIKLVKAANPTQKSVLDCMMEEMEHYVEHLEEKVSERTAELDAAMKQTEGLLHKILPPSVAVALSKGETVPPESFESVTIYFSDIVSFTDLAAESTPIQIVGLLNDLYTTFDSIIDAHDVYKVETIGDAYMCISGLPTRNGIDHARHIANMAIDIASACGKFKIHHRPGQRLRVRIGIHSGSVVAGVVGVKMPRYCLFGDTVNTASRMESNSLANKIHLSIATKMLLTEIGGYQTRRRQTVNIKGKGTMETYWLIGRQGYDDKLPLETARLEPGDVDEDATRTVNHRLPNSATEPPPIDI